MKQEMNRIIKFRGYSTFFKNWYYGAYIKVGINKALAQNDNNEPHKNYGYM